MDSWTILLITIENRKINSTSFGYMVKNRKGNSDADDSV